MGTESPPDFIYRTGGDGGNGGGGGEGGVGGSGGPGGSGVTPGMGKELGAALAGVPQKGVIQAKQANLGMLVPPMEGHPGRLVCQACQAT